MDEPHIALREHLERLFPDHEIACLPGISGPITERITDFRIFRVSPGERFPGWIYVSSGCWAATATDGHGLEFALLAPSDEWVHLETITINAYYHAGPPHQRLDVGHTVPIGRPWLDSSPCDHFLVSLPYPLGRDFEICTWEQGHARILWLLPISETERDFKAIAGMEALETRLEEAEIDFLDPHRPLVA